MQIAGLNILRARVAVQRRSQGGPPGPPVQPNKYIIV